MIESNSGIVALIKEALRLEESGASEEARDVYDDNSAALGYLSRYLTSKDNFGRLTQPKINARMLDELTVLSNISCDESVVRYLEENNATLTMAYSCIRHSPNKTLTELGEGLFSIAIEDLSNRDHLPCIIHNIASVIMNVQSNRGKVHPQMFALGVFFYVSLVWFGANQIGISEDPRLYVDRVSRMDLEEHHCCVESYVAQSVLIMSYWILRCDVKGVYPDVADSNGFFDYVFNKCVAIFEDAFDLEIDVHGPFDISALSDWVQS